MPKVDLLNIKGDKLSRIDLPAEIFAAKINQPLMAQAIRVYLSNQRRARARTKTRGEVRGSRRKIWRQKGTGRARHGDRYAPIFVGGGRAHGPTGQENFHLKLTKKMKKKALFSALSSKCKEGEILVIKGLEKIEPKTKKMATFLDKVVFSRQPAGKKIRRKPKATLVLPQVLKNVILAARNIEGVQTAQASLLHPYGVLNGGQLVVMEESIEVLKNRFLGKPAKKANSKK